MKKYGIHIIINTTIYNGQFKQLTNKKNLKNMKDSKKVNSYALMSKRKMCIIIILNTLSKKLLVIQIKYIQ